VLLTTAFFFAPVSPAKANPAVATPVVPEISTGMMVPLYTSPTDGSWAALIQTKIAYPNVPMVAIVNPQSGPGNNASHAYAAGIRELQAAGIKVLGYVATGYGSLPVASAERDIAAYWSWYQVNGTMFDEMPAASGQEGYYDTLNAYAKSLGMTFTVGNPGGPISTSYVGILDTLIIYENSGLPNATSISILYKGFDRSNFAVVSYGVGYAQQSSVLAGISSAANYIYFTNATLPNPYHSLPGYLMSEVSSLNLRRR